MIGSHSSPVIVLLVGGLAGVVCVRWLFEPSFLTVLLPGAALCLLLGTVLSFGRSLNKTLGLLLIGFGLFALYAGYRSYRNRIRRHWLVNRRLNLEGNWRPPNQFSVRRVNGFRHRARLYFTPRSSFRDLSQYRSDGRVLINLTGTVNWYGVDSNFRQYLKNRGFAGRLDVERIHSVRVRPEPEEGWIASVRRSVELFFNEVQPRAPTSVSLLKALVLGTTDFSNRLTILLRRLGLYHLFVISGLHVGLMFYTVWFLLEDLPDVPRRSLAGGILLAYVSFLRWPLPATRAMVMLAVGGLSTCLNRRVQLRDVLGVTVLVFMVHDPFVIFAPGFQLSVGAVAGIMLVRSVVERYSGSTLPKLALVTLGAYAGVTPVLVYHFGYLSPVALPGGLLGAMLFPGLVATIGVQLLALWVHWSFVYESVEGLLDQGIVLAVEALGQWPMVVSIPEVSVPAVGVILLGLYGFLRPKTSRFLRVLLAVLLVTALWAGRRDPPGRSVFLGTAGGGIYVVMTTEHGHSGLFLPAGTRLNSYSFDSMAQRLQSMGIHHLDVVFSDYSRGMIQRVDPPFTIGTVVVPWRSQKPRRFGSITISGSHTTLSTGSFELRFDGRYRGEVPLRSNGFAAVTSTEKCLVVDSNVIRERTFDRLRGTGCEMVFLEDSPVRFSFDGRTLGRGKPVKTSFGSRVVNRLWNGLYDNGNET